MRKDLEKSRGNKVTLVLLTPLGWHFKAGERLASVSVPSGRDVGGWNRPSPGKRIGDV